MWLEGSEKPPPKLHRGTARSLAGPCKEHGYGCTSEVIRGLENSPWREAGTLGLLSLEEKAENRAERDNALQCTRGCY